MCNERSIVFALNCGSSKRDEQIDLVLSIAYEVKALVFYLLLPRSNLPVLATKHAL